MDLGFGAPTLGFVWLNVRLRANDIVELQGQEASCVRQARETEREREMQREKRQERSRCAAKKIGE
jgi:hypothetical protein